ncbi:MAG: hypothetical protein V4549_17810, partial [Bacteroidota bacterium]
MKDTVLIDSLVTKTDLTNLTDRLADKITSTISNSVETIGKEEKLWGLFTYDTVFTVVVTLLIFIIGICIDRLIKYWDKLKKQKESRLYFKHFLDIIIDKTCPQLIKLYNEVYQNNGIDAGIPTAPPKILTS